MGPKMVCVKNALQLHKILSCRCRPMKSPGAPLISVIKVGSAKWWTRTRVKLCALKPRSYTRSWSTYIDSIWNQGVTEFFVTTAPTDWSHLPTNLSRILHLDCVLHCILVMYDCNFSELKSFTRRMCMICFS